MAQFKDLVVSGSQRVLGNSYSNNFVGDLSGNAATATSATNDSAGQQINTTYIKGISVNGRVISYTKGDDTLATITTQDTTYDTGTDSVEGLTKLYSSTGSNTDGTMTQAAISTALSNIDLSGYVEEDSANYIKSASVSGDTLTLTKGDDSTVTFTDSGASYSTGTDSVEGLTKLYSTTGNNTDGAMTQSAVTTALSNIDLSGYVEDDSANYIKSASVSGDTLTLTKGDDTTVTFTDTDTTYSTGTSSTEGLTKLYTSTGSNTDGAMDQNSVTTALGGKLDSNSVLFVKNVSLTNKTLTVTSGDNSTNTFTTVDTTYETGTSTTEGLTKLYTTTGSNTDGTMTQDAITSAIAAVNSFEIEIITDFPTENIDPHKIYFKLSANSETNNVYDEFIYINNGWEQIGSTAVDLSDYSTTTQMNTAISTAISNIDYSAFATTTDLESKLDVTSANYIKGLSVNGTVITYTKGDNTTGTITTQDTDTTYTQATSSDLGLVKLYTATGNNTDGTMDQNSITSAIDSSVSAAVSTLEGEIGAVADDLDVVSDSVDLLGTNIDSKVDASSANYIKSASVSGDTLTLTKGDDSTVTFTQSDTTYSTGTSTVEGLTKLYTSTGNNTDGTMDQNSISTELSGKVSASSSNYIKGASVSEDTLTLTKGDNTTVTFTNTDTTYNTGTASVEGLTKLYTGTGSNTDGTMTQAAITTALGNLVSFETEVVSTLPTTDISDHTIYFVPSTNSETDNAYDEFIYINNSWEQIGSTAVDISGKVDVDSANYIKSASVSGSTLTLTKGDDSTVTFTDTDTTYSTGTSSTSGLTKLYTTTGSNTDGTMDQNSITTALGNINSFDIETYDVTSTTIDAILNGISSPNDHTLYVIFKDIDVTTEGGEDTFDSRTDELNYTHKHLADIFIYADNTFVSLSQEINIDDFITSSDLSTELSSYATQTYVGTQITSTFPTNFATEYATAGADNFVGVSISNNTITFTQEDGTTEDVTVTDTTYSTGTSSTEGLTKIYSTTGSNTDGAMDQNSVTTALGGKVDSTSANYIKSASVSGDTLTLTKGDDTTVTFTQSDTTYNTGTSTTSGITKLYTSTGSNTDGAMDQATVTTALGGKVDSTSANYIKSAAVSGDALTLTKGDDTTVTFTQSDTTYNTGTSTVEGLTKLYSSTGSNTDGTMTQSAITSAIAAVSSFDVEVVTDLPVSDISTHKIYFVPSTASETGNVYDEFIYVNNAWEQIGSTAVDISGKLDIASANYIKSASVSSGTLTLTKGDDSTVTFSDTTYSTGTSSVAGLTKLYTSTGVNTDGTMDQNSINTALGGKVDTTSSNYIKSASVSSGTLTLTKGDDTTVTFSDTTYSQADTSALGLVKLYTSTGTGTDGTMDQNSVTTALGGKVDTTSANYIKSLSISGTTITYTRGDDTTGTLTTQDTNTTYSTGTASTAGLTKLYTSSGSNTDGTMTQNAITELVTAQAGLNSWDCGNEG